MDLRLPIGIIFTLYGVLLTGYGVFTKGSEIYEKSLGINVNIIWGVVILVFGLAMWLLAKRGKAS
ncbi:MAG: hypothetical protein V4733_06115 [Verrucomicrobiota bacterium]